MTKREWCRENGIAEVHYIAVGMVLECLTDLELASQYNAATAGFNPTDVLGFDKIESLYEKVNDSMNKDTLAIFGQVVSDRIK